ncbi:Cdc6/Cdc18 family protein [Halostella salina]|uniref:Cdc6/Cdc18 family protein n=1 Tax=Halostella salina TaxID=1547897 RepID=UPI0013CEC89E|nr:Cdc6/Cdc18 family protein [Halostella salina]
MVPERDLVVHRADELTQITNALAPALDGRTPPNLFLFGPSGVGKTMAARIAVRELKQEADIGDAYVNCWETYERTGLQYSVATQLLHGAAIHRQSTPRSEWLTTVREKVDHPCLVILDEVDQLEDKRVLYDLQELPAVSLVCIANQAEGLFAGMDSRTRSRVGIGHRIELDSYSVTQLASILRKRIDQLQLGHAVSERQLERVGRVADGDARIAISMLRIVVENARAENGPVEITDDMIEAALGEAHNALRSEHMDRLTDFQWTLYEIVKANEPIPPRDLYEEYCERAENPKTDRTVRTHLGKLVQYDILAERGASQTKRYLTASLDSDR